jgi:hypothetical protein
MHRIYVSLCGIVAPQVRSRIDRALSTPRLHVLSFGFPDATPYSTEQEESIQLKLAKESTISQLLPILHCFL